jgi:AcrR family transcriptional regulator
MPDDEAALPRAVALAWGVAAEPQRGPKREMSVERIVEAAMELADDGGLAAVSMASVAAKLGFTPMSLYRYVTAKDDIVLLMWEAGIGVPPERIREAEGWRAGLRVWAEETLDRYAERPWLLDIPNTVSQVTPNNLAWLDSGLAALADARAPARDRVSIVLTLAAQARFAGLARRESTESGDLVESLVTAEEFPAVRAALDAGASTTATPASFEFGLERILDGIEAAVTAGIATPEPEVRSPLEEAAARDPKAREATKRRREAEQKLREARKNEREALKAARERAERRA